MNPGDLRRHLRISQAGVADPGEVTALTRRLAAVTGYPPGRLAQALPELPAAQHKLRRSRRRHGWAATFDATAAATGICIDLRFRAAHHPLWIRWERRLDLLLPAGYRRSMFMAVIFPEVAALAAVLAALDQQALTADDASAGIDGFSRAAQHALGCADPPHRHDISDALKTWTKTRAAGRLLQPASIYPRGRSP